MYKRTLDLSKIDGSFFLWGPRQAGKSHLLHSCFGDAVWIDLLRSENFIKYQQDPSRLRQEVVGMKNSSKWVVIDEIQKIPRLLDEVHYLIESQGVKFARCGSSARKLKRGHANLLGGRAYRRELFGLTSRELGPDFDLEKAINRGLLPNHYLNRNYRDLLRSYCTDYLKEEIFDEGLVRNLPAFSSFLHVASFSDTEQVEFANIARDVGVSPPTIRSYFEILQDTLIGEFVPVYRKRAKRRLQMSPKFYFFDVGVVNSLARRGHVTQGSELFGKAFENWIFHELRCYRSYRNQDMQISFWRLAGGREVDFIINDLECAIEVKGTRKVTEDHLKGLRELKVEHPRVKRCILVSTESNSRKTQDGIEVLSLPDFLAELWNDEIAKPL